MKKTLIKLERIATTNGNRKPPAIQKEPRNVRRKHEREQLRNLKRTDLSADIDTSKRGKISMGLIK